MEEHAIRYARSYQQFKGELDYELNRAANGFVRIGFLLRQARDTDILKESGYTNVNEFAKSEYGLDASQVSRFININEKFSKEDDPEQLKDEYKGYGVAKLGLMLTLPGPIVEELSPEMSKSEIQTVKEEYEAEQKITPIEVMTEDTDSNTAEFEFLEKLLYEIGRSEADIMAALLKEEGFTISPEPRKEMGILAPAGQKMYIARIPAMGKFTLNIKDGRATVINMRDGEKKEYTSQHISEALAGLCSHAVDLALKQQDKYGENGIPDEFEMWALLYDQSFPVKDVKNQRIAPVQNKESRVSVQKKEKNDKKLQKTAEKDENRTLSEKSGNDDDAITAAEDLTEGSDYPEEIDGPMPEGKSSLDKNTLKGYKAGLTSDTHACERLIRDNQFRALRTKLQSMLNTVGRIIDALEETNDNN
jgi:hypothetical protein